LLRYLFPKNIYYNIDSILVEILTDKKLVYNNWTKASSLYTTKKFGPEVGQQLVSKYLGSENILLKQTAEFAAGNS
jgi:hypothetical protein